MVGWILRTIRRPRITGLASEHLKEFPSDLPIHQFSWQYYARFGSWEVFPIFFPIDRNFATSIPKMVGEFWHCDYTEKWGEVLARAHRSHSSAVGNSGWKLGLVREGYPGENKLKKKQHYFFSITLLFRISSIRAFLKMGGALSLWSSSDSSFWMGNHIIVGVHCWCYFQAVNNYQGPKVTTAWKDVDQHFPHEWWPLGGLII